MESQKFKPTQEMERVYLAYCDMEVKPTIKARMEEAHVERTKWYDWLKIDGFLEWWHEQTEAFMERSLSELNKIAYMKAGSDFRYMELLQMKYGKFRRTGDITTDGKSINTNINLSAFTQEELDNLEQLTRKAISTTNTDKLSSTEGTV